MAHGDDPADRYNHRTAKERDRERPVDMPDILSGVAVDGHEVQRGDIEHMDADVHRENRVRSVMDDGPDDRAGAGGAPDYGAGDGGGTLGTSGGRREQDR